VDALIAWARRGPRGARVDDVSSSGTQPRGERDFVVTHVAGSCSPPATWSPHSTGSAPRTSSATTRRARRASSRTSPPATGSGRASNGELLPDKPVLYHWLAALPCAAAGFSETAVRLPSALAGAALVAWTAALGADLLGAPAGLAAAALLATTPALFTHARVAAARRAARAAPLAGPRARVPLVVRRRAPRRDGGARVARRRDLAKGPVAPVLFALTLGAFLAWQGELRRLPRLVPRRGLAAFAVLGLGWYAAALRGVGREFVHAHLVGRYLRNLAGGLAAGGAYSPKPLAYHLLFYAKHLPAIALPWTPFAVLALWQAWRTGGFRDPRLRFLVCWAAAPVVAFTPAEWKLRYYLLPSPAGARAGDGAGGAPARGRARATALLPPAWPHWRPARRAWSRSRSSHARSRSPLRPEHARRAHQHRRPVGRPRRSPASASWPACCWSRVAWRAWAPLLAIVATATILWMAVAQPALGGGDQPAGFAEELRPQPSPRATRRPRRLAFWSDTIRAVAV